MTTNTRDIHYICSDCGREVGKDNLRARIVSWKELGKGGKMVASRTEKWICIIPQGDGTASCLDRDPVFQLPKFTTAPGLADTSIAEVVVNGG